MLGSRAKPVICPAHTPFHYNPSRSALDTPPLTSLAQQQPKVLAALKHLRHLSHSRLLQKADRRQHWSSWGGRLTVVK